jgi:CubicO group peptidase (beta-lactamase class C family)
MIKLCYSKKYLLILMILLLRTPVPCYSQTTARLQNSQQVPQTIDELKAELDSLMKRYDIPGAGIAIVSKNSIVYLGGLGYANIDLHTPVDENTLFRAGSISKSFVALGILKLVEEGKIDLQTPVKQILPEVGINNPWEDTHPIRVVHLLEHTAGLNDPHFNDYYLDGNPDIPLKEGLKISKHYLDIRWPPGAYRSYSSAGYMLAGIIIEELTGERFEDYLKREILNPIGMTTSTFRFNAEIQQLLAQGYKANYQVSQWWNSYSRPAGSLNSSASKMAKFLQLMLNKGQIGKTRILAESTIDRMERSTTDPAVLAGLESRTGLGIGTGYYKGIKWYTHYGSIMGFCGAYGYCRDINMGCVLLTNRWDVDFETGITKLWNTLRNSLMKDADLPQKPHEPQISEQTLEAYAGYYKWCNPYQRLSAWIDLILNYQVLKLEDQKLYSKNVFFGTWEPLISVTENSFRDSTEFHASTVFIKTASGKQAFISGDGFYQKTVWCKPWLHGILFGFAWIMMLSSIPYALGWIPVVLYRRIIKRQAWSPYLRIRIIPLLAVIILLFAFSLVGMQVSQSIAYIGQKTPTNVFFYLSTWSFAILSFLSLIFSIRSLKKPVQTGTRIYALILSLACFGMTLYWSYWGWIGLKLWAY